MKKHFIDCPVNKGYEVCTCGMCGEEICLIDWQIAKQEGKLPIWHITARLSLFFFAFPEEIKRTNNVPILQE
jgi:hypothetical protein